MLGGIAPPPRRETIGGGQHLESQKDKPPRVEGVLWGDGDVGGGAGDGVRLGGVEAQLPQRRRGPPGRMRGRGRSF